MRGCSSRPAEGLVILARISFCMRSRSWFAGVCTSLAGEFEFEWPSPSGAFLALLGGVFLGWGAMVSFGCTIGTLLSGIHASSLSGWLFGVALVGGILLWLARAEGIPQEKRTV